jgi:hypothetical protein
MDILNSIDREIRVINEVESKLFEVKRIQLHPNIEGFNSPQSFGIYKSTGGQPLGVVGSQYRPIQPLEIFKQFKDSLIENGISLENMHYNEYKGGSKINFRLPVGKVQFDNLKGEPDESILYLNMQTGFDGLTKTTLYLSLFRLVCTNGMKAITTEFNIAFKNTINNVHKVNYFTSEIKKATNQTQKLNEMVNRLNAVQINQRILDQFLLDTTGYDRKTINDQSTRAQNIFDDINRAVGIELQRTGNSLWGLVNGITYYTNHLQVKDNKDEHVMIGGGLKLNTKAQQVALALAN